MGFIEDRINTLVERMRIGFLNYLNAEGSPQFTRDLSGKVRVDDLDGQPIVLPINYDEYKFGSPEFVDKLVEVMKPKVVAGMLNQISYTPESIESLEAKLKTEPSEKLLKQLATKYSETYCNLSNKADLEDPDYALPFNDELRLRKNKNSERIELLKKAISSLNNVKSRPQEQYASLLGSLALEYKNYAYLCADYNERKTNISKAFEIVSYIEKNYEDQILKNKFNGMFEVDSCGWHQLAAIILSASEHHENDVSAKRMMLEKIMSHLTKADAHMDQIKRECVIGGGGNAEISRHVTILNRLASSHTHLADITPELELKKQLIARAEKFCEKYDLVIDLKNRPAEFFNNIIKNSVAKSFNDRGNIERLKERCVHSQIEKQDHLLKALEYFDESLKHFDHCETHLNKAGVYAHLEQYDRALIEYIVASQSDIGFKSRKGLQFCFEKIGSLPKIIDYMRQSFKENKIKNAGLALADLIDMHGGYDALGKEVWEEIIDLLKQDQKLGKHLANIKGSSVNIDLEGPLTMSSYVLKVAEGKVDRETLNKEYGVTAAVKQAVESYGGKKAEFLPFSNLFEHKDGRLYMLQRKGGESLKDMIVSKAPHLEIVENLKKSLESLAEMHICVTRSMKKNGEKYELEYLDAKQTKQKLILDKIDYLEPIKRRFIDLILPEQKTEVQQKYASDFLESFDKMAKQNTLNLEYFLHTDALSHNVLRGGVLIDFERVKGGSVGDPIYDVAKLLEDLYLSSIFKNERTDHLLYSTYLKELDKHNMGPASPAKISDSYAFHSIFHSICMSGYLLARGEAKQIEDHQLMSSAYFTKAKILLENNKKMAGCEDVLKNFNLLLADPGVREKMASIGWTDNPLLSMLNQMKAQNESATQANYQKENKSATPKSYQKGNNFSCTLTGWSASNQTSPPQNKPKP